MSFIEWIISCIYTQPYNVERKINFPYCMVCGYVWEDNPQALVSGLSPVHTHNHTITKEK